MKRYLTLALLVSFTATSIAQPINVTSYPFTFNTNVLGEDMSSGTTKFIGPNTFISSSGTLNDIGFDFRYSGTRYTQFDVASAGFLRLGVRVLHSSSSNIIVNELFNTNQYPVIACKAAYLKAIR